LEGEGEGGGERTVGIVAAVERGDGVGEEGGGGGEGFGGGRLGLLGGEGRGVEGRRGGVAEACACEAEEEGEEEGDGAHNGIIADGWGGIENLEVRMERVRENRNRKLEIGN
jgi:hypothetical protein